MMETLCELLFIINDRKNFVSPAYVIDSLSIIPDRIQIEDNTYVIIITRGHLHNKDVQKHVLKTKAKYIGMMGSKKNEASTGVIVSIASQLIKMRRKHHDV